MLLLSTADFFQNKLLQKTIRKSNCLDPDLDLHCLQRLSADDKRLLLARKGLQVLSFNQLPAARLEVLKAI